MKTILLFVLFLSLAGCSSNNLGAIRKPLNDNNGSAAVIKSEAAAAAEIAPEVKPHTDTITKEANKIEKNTLKADQIVSALEMELTKEKENSNRWLRSALAATIFASGLAVAITLALFFFGHIKSLIATVIAVAVFGAAVAMQIMLAYMVYIAAGFAVIVGGAIAYFAFKQRKAVDEIVMTVEAVKPKLPEDFKAIADTIQSETTKQIVNKSQGKKQ